MVHRDITPVLQSTASQYPVITLTGPRQSGKTTLVKSVFSRLPYVNLEKIENREFAESDPTGFLEKYKNGAVIDEVQRVPGLLSGIQLLVDEKQQQPGMFVLTGSSQFTLLQSISQSLAGRTVILKLLPFSIAETTAFGRPYDYLDYLYTGFYPAIYDKKREPTLALSSYFETYIERDVRRITQIQNLGLFQRFIKLCAGRCGQLLNLNSLAADTGITHTTARQWLTILEASYIVFLLEPYHANIKKRLVKSPKLYFYDVGLASFLMGIENKQQLETHPLRGSLFENMAVLDILKFRYNRGRVNNLNFYRDSNGNEVDLLYKQAQHILPVEIKAGQTINRDYFKGLRSLEAVVNEYPYGKILLYAGSRNEKRHDVEIMNILEIEKALDKKFPD